MFLSFTNCRGVIIREQAEKYEFMLHKRLLLHTAGFVGTAYVSAQDDATATEVLKKDSEYNMRN